MFSSVLFSLAHKAKADNLRLVHLSCRLSSAPTIAPAQAAAVHSAPRVSASPSYASAHREGERVERGRGGGEEGRQAREGGRAPVGPGRPHTRPTPTPTDAPHPQVSTRSTRRPTGPTSTSRRSRRRPEARATGSRVGDLGGARRHRGTVMRLARNRRTDTRSNLCADAVSRLCWTSCTRVTADIS